MGSPVNNHSNFHREYPGIEEDDKKISGKKIENFFSKNNIYGLCTDIHCSSESHLPENKITVEWNEPCLEFARFPFPRIWKDLEKFLKLTNLILTCIDLKNLQGKDLKKLENLTNLHFRACNLSTVPIGLSGLKNLRVLQFTGDTFPELPKDFFQKQLEEVTITENNNLTKIPEIPLDSSIKKLDLSMCENFEKIPQTIVRAKDLHTLIVSGTNVRSMPKEIGELPELRCLGIQNTPLRGLPDLRTTKLETFMDVKDMYDEGSLLPDYLKIDKEKLPQTFDFAQLYPRRQESSEDSCSECKSKV